MAVLLPVINSSFFSNLLQGAENCVYKRGKQLIYYNTDNSFEREKECMKLLKKQNLQGVIIDSVCPISEELKYEAWLKKKAFTVYL